MIERTKDDNALLQEVLENFHCDKDRDIEYFLHKRAIEFENLSKARTYLLCDENQFFEIGFSLDKLIIYGYLALAVKILSVPKETSNRARKELDGLSAKIHGEVITDFPCFLIGQLARNSNVEKESLKGEVLLEQAYSIIEVAVNAVGGRYILIECLDNKNLITFYRKNGFTEIARIPDGEHQMVQMIRKF